MAKSSTNSSNPPKEPPSATDPGAPNPPPAGNGKVTGFVCLEPVKHKGKRHAPGDLIELTKDEAKPLIEQQAVAVA